MAALDVMTRLETFKMVYEVMFAALSGKSFHPPLDIRKVYIVREDMEEAIDNAGRLMADTLSGMGQCVTDEFEEQEIIQQKVDEMIADIVILTRRLCGHLKRPVDP